LSLEVSQSLGQFREFVLPLDGLFEVPLRSRAHFVEIRHEAGPVVLPGSGFVAGLRTRELAAEPAQLFGQHRRMGLALLGEEAQSLGRLSVGRLLGMGEELLCKSAFCVIIRSESESRIFFEPDPLRGEESSENPHRGVP
jgi:hypothetical protein